MTPQPQKISKYSGSITSPPSAPGGGFSTTPQPQQEYYCGFKKDVCNLVRPHASTPNPCEEQGCTDTEQCDEICEHSRIYSPAWVKEHDTAIRNATIVALQEKMCDLYDSGMKNPLATFDAAVFELYNVQSLRTPTQEHP